MFVVIAFAAFLKYRLSHEKTWGFFCYMFADHLHGYTKAQMVKQVISALHMIPLTEAVSIPFFSKYINDEGDFKPEEVVTKSANVMLAELERYCEASKVLRGVNKNS